MIGMYELQLRNTGGESGMDWSAVATAAVGIAGIAGALWQGKRAREAASNDLQQNLKAASENLLTTINADNERARLSEKRRISACRIKGRKAYLPPIFGVLAPKQSQILRRWSFDQGLCDRLIYAGCLAAINAANLASSTHKDARNARNAGDEPKWTNEEARMEAWSEAEKARTDMLDAVMELELIAPEDVMQHARQAREHLIQYWVETSDGAEPDYSLLPSGRGVLRHLRSAMRTDLGKSAE
jgi:hypothetical protein